MTRSVRAFRIEVVRTAAMVAFCVLGPRALTAQSPRPASPSGAVVSGTVYDSIARTMIAGVTVQYVAADSAGSRGFAALTDSSGRYRLSDVPAGRYLAGFFRTGADTLGLEPGTRIVDVRAGEQRVDLATPSPRTVIRSMCPAATTTDATGLLIGHIRDAESLEPVPGASVTVEWMETIIEGANIDERVARLGARSEGPGWFAICGVPSDAMVSVHAARGADSSGQMMLNVPANDVRHLTIHIARQISVINRLTTIRLGDDSLPPLTVLRGGARLTGTVRDERGRPIHNAHAMVWETAIEALTNDRGVFTIDSLPSGTHTLEVRALRHAPGHAIVHLSAQRPAVASVTLAAAPAVLSSVTVKGELVYAKNLAGFEERRGEGWGLLGHFISPAEIERRPRTRLGSLLQGMAGVFVDSRRSGATVRMRASGDPNGFCTPSLYVDGTRDVNADFDTYQSDRIAGIEVYVRESWRPSEFLDGNQCGAVVIWTRPAPPKKP